MTPFEQAVAEIEIYGFTLVADVLNQAEVEALRSALVRCGDEVGVHGYENRNAASILVANLPSLDPAFFQVIDHPAILPILEHFLDPTLILGSLSSRIVRPGDGEQDFHSDIPAHMLNPVSPVMMNTVWMLDDFSPEIGGTRIVPGSHKSGLAGPPEGLEVRHVFQPEAAAGSVLVFNGQCWHAGGANSTGGNRHALFAHYRKSMLMFQLDPHDGFPEEWYDRLTQRQKGLLRMQSGLNEDHAADEHLARLPPGRGRQRS